ncbi:Lipid carrier : UDP-N-acetylgalactosaminyltransferase [hydrothermal vent metagenome]|uniref:Lipid carrier: UDP-N-acetylgalactosaminyltransferase n=1 Tax=hydrothermal vent metagenome TaxID=652676 RepID=A0A3B1DEX5_9ZZZZ
MIRVTRLFFTRLFYICIDILFFIGAAILACVLRPTTLPFEITPYNLFFNINNSFQFIFLFWGLIVILLNYSHGLYDTKREIFESTEIWQVIRSVFMSSLIVIVGIYLVKIEGFPRTVLVLCAALIVAFFSVWRILKRGFVSYLVRRGYNNFNVLIIGAGKVGNALVQEMNKHPGLGFNIIGYLDDFKKGPKGKNTPDVIGKIEDFIRIARREFVDKVFITIHPSDQIFLRLLEQAKELGVAVRVIPQGFELMPGEFTKYNIGFIPVLEYCNAQMCRQQVGKRLFDFVAVFSCVIFLLPIFLIIAILVKLDSPGPIFYLSHRYGRGGRIFNMYKFRSMTQDAEQVLEGIKSQNEVDGPIFKIRKDPRITKLGKVLRKLSLDELPQLLNVLKGEMSLVGPRPLPIAQVEREDIRQLKRLEVRPGITGLWQIRGRSDISFKRLVKWDVWYINNWSFWLDLNILLQTVPVVIKGKGAY